MNTNHKLLIIAIAFSVFASVMSTSMITIAFIDLVNAFDIDHSSLQYRNVLFFSFFASGLPLFGALSDKIGARKIIKLGLLLFIVSGIISGLSTNYSMFLFSQSMQAIADSMIVPSIIVLIRNSFVEEKIGWAFGWFSATLATATLVGPAIGGIIIEYGSWRFIFLTLILIAFIAIILTGKYLPKEKEEVKSNVKLPIINTLLLVTFLISFQIVLVNNNIYIRVTLFIVTLLTIILFIFLEKQKEEGTIIPKKALGNKVFLLSLVRVFLLFMVANTIVLLIPSLMRESFSISPNVVGFIIIIESLIAVLFASLAGKFADIAPLKTMLCGMIVTITGLIFLCFEYFFDINPILLFSVFFLFVGLGATFTTPSLNKVALVSVPAKETGVYMGFFQMIQFGTGAFASGILGFMLSGNEALTLSNVKYVIITMVIFLFLSLITLTIDYKMKKVNI